MKIKVFFGTIAFAVLTMFLGSCNKEYTCTCFMANGVITGQTTFKDVDKNQAKTTCNYYNTFADSGESCSLKP